MSPARQTSIVSGLALAVAGAVLLVVTAVLLVQVVRQPRPGAPMGGPADVNAIAGWMTVRYISRAYDVPEPLLLSSLNITEQEARGQSLAQIARRQHRNVQETVSSVRSTVEQYRSTSARVAPAPS